MATTLSFFLNVGQLLVAYMNVKRIYIVLDLSLLRGGDREEHLGRVIRVVSRTWLHCAGQNDDVSFGFTLYDSDVGGYMLSYQMNMVAQGLGTFHFFFCVCWIDDDVGW